MDIIIYTMIVLGSALMVVNIMRYFRLTQNIRKAKAVTSMLLLYIPLMLLIFFLFGYIFVGVFGKPDLMMSGILFGGSIFVFMLMMILGSIISRVLENDRILSRRYSELRRNIDSITKDSLAVFSVDLTKDTVETRGGSDMYESDRTAEKYSQLLMERTPYMICKPFESQADLFTGEGLLRSFKQGRTNVSEIVLARRESGGACYVKLTATLTEHPETGDIMAFIDERACNDEMVNRTIHDSILADQYELIAYIESGKYTVILGDPEEAGSVVPVKPEGSFDEFIKERVLPVLKPLDDDDEAAAKSLSRERLAEELAEHGSYELNVGCSIDGRSYYKQFLFFNINTETRFFIMLVKDTTAPYRERTEQNERLSAALENAKKANAAKTLFFSNMSHDIRTPMNAIIGFADIARHTDDPEKVREYLDRINSSCEHLLALINDVLEISRIESGKFTLVPVPNDLSEVIGSVRTLFADQMRKKNLDFRAELKDVKHPFVLCDKTRLNRVLLNLVSNAYKFTKEGGSVSVTVKETASDESTARFEFRVKDTGVGMSPDFAARVFNAYERDRSSDEGNIQGTGLGMSITKSIVELMKGNIRVESELGKGSEFIIDVAFPIAEREEIVVEEAMKAGIDGFDPDGRRILIVDDNPINRDIAQLLLEEAGFETEFAENGLEAVNIVKEAPENHFSLVLMDMQMPVMNGLDAARAIRALPDGRSRIPIIAATANVFEEDQRNVREAGMNAHIAKPFVPADIINKIENEIIEAEKLKTDN